MLPTEPQAGLDPVYHADAMVPVEYLPGYRPGSICCRCPRVHRTAVERSPSLCLVLGSGSAQTTKHNVRSPLIRILLAVGERPSHALRRMPCALKDQRVASFCRKRSGSIGGVQAGQTYQNCKLNWVAVAVLELSSVVVSATRTSDDIRICCVTGQNPHSKPPRILSPLRYTYSATWRKRHI